MNTNNKYDHIPVNFISLSSIYTPLHDENVMDDIPPDIRVNIMDILEKDEKMDARFCHICKYATRSTSVANEDEISINLETLFKEMEVRSETIGGCGSCRFSSTRMFSENNVNMEKIIHQNNKTAQLFTNRGYSDMNPNYTVVNSRKLRYTTDLMVRQHRNVNKILKLEREMLVKRVGYRTDLISRQHRNVNKILKLEREIFDQRIKVIGNQTYVKDMKEKIREKESLNSISPMMSLQLDSQTEFYVKTQSQSDHKIRICSFRNDCENNVTDSAYCESNGGCCFEKHYELQK